MQRITILRFDLTDEEKETLSKAHEIIRKVTALSKDDSPELSKMANDADQLICDLTRGREFE